MQRAPAPEAPAPRRTVIAVWVLAAAVARYVSTLEELCREAPHNWFNFFDVWADAALATDEAA